MKLAVPSSLVPATHLGLAHGLLALLFFGHSPATHAADIHWANPVNGNWNTAANWSPAQVPLPTDRAFITVDGTYTVTVSAVTTVGGLEVGGLTGTQTFTNSQNFILNGPGVIGVNGAWGVGLGGVAGTSDVTVNGRFAWYGGTLNRTGTVTIATGANLALAGGSKTFSNGRFLLQPGAVGNWNAGVMFSSTGLGAIMENEGTFDINGDLVWNAGASVPPRFINRGLVRKTAGTATSARLLGLFENGVGGQLRVQAGTMEIHGSSVGRFTLDAGTTLIVATGGTSQNVFGAGTVVEGPGLLSISGGVTRLGPNAGFGTPAPALRVQTGELQFNSGLPITAQSLILISGRISGSDTVTVTDLAGWQAGEIAAGLTLVAAGGVDMTGIAARTLNGTLQLGLGSTSTWRAGNIISTAGGRLENFSDLTMTGDMDWTVNSIDPPRIVNSGRWTKAGGTLESRLAVFFEAGSGSVVQVESGTLTLAAGAFSNGEFHVGAGATLQCSASSQNFTLAPNGSLSGMGRCLVTVGNFQAQVGSHLTAFQGTLEVSGGTCQLNSADVATVDSLILGGGTLSGQESISVLGPTVWRATTVAGALTIEAWGGLYLTNSSTRSFQGGTFINRGLARWTNGPIAGSVGPAMFSNAFGAQMEIGGPQSQSWTLGAGSSASFINAGTITVQTPATRHLSLNVPFENRGDLFLMNSEVWFDVPGSFRQTDGRTVLAGTWLRLFTTALELAGGELSGSGAIAGSVTNNGYLVAKDPAFPLVISGSYTQSSQGFLDLDWSGPGAAFVPLQVGGTAKLDGALRINLANGYTPSPGDSRTALTAGTRLGTFGQFNLITPARVALLYSSTAATVSALPGSFTVNPVPPQSVIEGDRLRVQLGVSPQLPVGALSYIFVAPPVLNAVLDQFSGEFSWTPLEDQGPGEYDFTIRVRDAAIPPVSVDITFHVSVLESNDPPVLQPASIPAVLEGTPLAFALSTLDPDIPANPLTYALVSNGGATGLAVSPDGNIQWTPGLDKGPGSYTVRVSVTDVSADAVNEKSLSTTGSFTIRVDGVNTPPVIDTIAEQTIPPGAPWSFQVPAHDGDLPAERLTYTLSGQPAGMFIDPRGVIFWTPGFDLVGQSWMLHVAVRDTGAGNPANVASAEAVFPIKVDRVAPAYGNSPWMQQAIDGVGDAGADAIIRVDSSGQTHVASLSFLPGGARTIMQVRLAHETGYGFRLETVAAYLLPLPADEPVLGRFHLYQQLDYEIGPDGTEHLVIVEPVGQSTDRIHYGRHRPGQVWEWQILASAWPDADGVFPLQAFTGIGGYYVTRVALALDGSGRPQLVFNAAEAVLATELPTVYRFYYAEQHADDTWSVEPLAETDLPNSRGGNVTLRIDGQDRPNIGLWVTDNEAGIRLEHRVRSTPNSWATTVVKGNLYPPTGPGAFHHSMALDEAGGAHFAFENPGSHKIEYAHRSGATWQSDPIMEGRRPALALTSDGRPMIAASRNVLAHGATVGRESYTRLWMITRQDAGQWSRPEIFHPPVPASNLEERPALSLALDERDTVFGALDTGSFLHDLVFVRTGSQEWSKQIIAEPPPGGRYENPILTLDAQGQPHVAATLVQPTVVQPAVFRPTETGGSWIGATFDTTFPDSSRGYHPSLAIAASGRRVLSFYEPAGQFGNTWLAMSATADPDRMEMKGFTGSSMGPSVAVWDDDGVTPLQYGVAQLDASIGPILAVARGTPPVWRETLFRLPEIDRDREPERFSIVRPPENSRWKGFTYVVYRVPSAQLYLAVHSGTGWIGDGSISDLIGGGGLKASAFHLAWDQVSDAPIIIFTGSPNSSRADERDPNNIHYAIRGTGNPATINIDTDWTTKYLGTGTMGTAGASINQVQADYRLGSTVVLYPTPGNPGQPAELRMLVGPDQFDWEASGPFINDSAHLGETVTDFSFAVSRNGRWHIAYVNEFGTLKFASRMPANQGVAPGNFVSTQPCPCSLEDFLDEDDAHGDKSCIWLGKVLVFLRAILLQVPPAAFAAAATPAQAAPAVAATPAVAAASLTTFPADELSVLRRLRDKMMQSPEGVRLLVLYAQHNPETRRLGLQDLYLLNDAFGVIQTFVPGFVAWLDGQGAGARITEEMINAVNSVWSRLADRGSPELRAAILGELARHHDLRDFIGLSFDQWAAAMGFNERFIAIVRTERLGASVRLTVNHLEGRAYTLLRSPTLEPSTWTPVANVTEEISGYVRYLTDPTPGNSQAFYRVVATP